MNRRVIDPSPTEIEARAEVIRGSWTEKERMKRAIWSPPAWLPPVLSAYELVERFTPFDETA